MARREKARYTYTVRTIDGVDTIHSNDEPEEGDYGLAFVLENGKAVLYNHRHWTKIMVVDHEA